MENDLDNMHKREIPVREYGDGLPVTLELDNNGRWTVVGLAEAGYASVGMDLLDLVEWIENNKEFIESLRG